MRAFGRTGFALVCSSVLLLPPAGRPQEAAAPVRVVDYAGLAREIVSHRGKVVLVDFWSVY